MELILEPGRAEKNYWRDLWRYRELFYFLAWRDILVRYKQTVIGVAWAVIRPFLTTIVFTFVFGKLGKFPAPAGVPMVWLPAVSVLLAVLPPQALRTRAATVPIAPISMEREVRKLSPLLNAGMGRVT